MINFHDWISHKDDTLGLFKPTEKEKENTRISNNRFALGKIQQMLSDPYTTGIKAKELKDVLKMYEKHGDEIDLLGYLNRVKKGTF